MGYLPYRLVTAGFQKPSTVCFMLGEGNHKKSQQHGAIVFLRWSPESFHVPQTHVEIWWNMYLDSYICIHSRCFDIWYLYIYTSSDTYTYMICIHTLIGLLLTLCHMHLAIYNTDILWHPGNCRTAGAFWCHRRSWLMYHFCNVELYAFHFP